MASSTPSMGMNWLPIPITTTRVPSTVVSNRLRMSPILTHGVRTHHAIEQLLAMPDERYF